MKTHQFTVRQVSDSVSRALRKKAKQQKVSLNRVLLDALESAVGANGLEVRYHDLDAFSGTWVTDEAVDLALADQRRVDTKDWQ